MFIKVTDAGYAEAWVNTEQISLIQIPSAVSPGDGKCRMFLGPIGMELSKPEAIRVVAVLEAAQVKLQISC